MIAYAQLYYSVLEDISVQYNSKTSSDSQRQRKYLIRVRNMIRMEDYSMNQMISINEFEVKIECEASYDALEKDTEQEEEVETLFNVEEIEAI